MARTATFSTKSSVAKALVNLDTLSRFLKLQLVEAGYLKAVTVPSTGKRGRPEVSYVMTGKARGLLALSRNWGKIENVYAKGSPVSEALAA
jgi:hypothetical protein